MHINPVSRGTAAAAMAIASTLALACGSSDSSTEFPAGQEPGVTVIPPTATLYPEQSVSFQAAVLGSASAAVTWSIMEGPSGGTVTSSGTYTAPPTEGTYRIVAASAVDPSVTGTATVTVTASPPPPAGSGSMTTAHRTSGVAPLAVFFDAVNTTPSGYASPFTWSSNVYQPTDYEGTHYVWNFGDPGSGVWSATNKPKNTATGYTAAHVYENPGTYTATLTIVDTSGTTRTYTQTITVTQFSGTTFYVAANGSDSNDGLSTATPFQTVNKAMSVLGTNVRILFRRGDTFNTGNYYNITAPGPGIIGAYGSGNRPIINCSYTGQANILQFFSPGNDWRVMDLDMVGPGAAAGPDVGPIGPPVDRQAVNLLQLRVVARNWSVAFGWGDWTPIFQTPHDGMFIVDSESPDADMMSAYVGGRRIALLGNNFHDVARSHVLRIWQGHKAVISNNRLWRPGGQRHAIKLHGPNLVEANRNLCPETRWVTITDNTLGASSTSQWTVSMGPQDGASDERVSHVVYERNRHFPSPSLTADVEGSSTFTMIRDNVFDGTTSGYYTGILYHRRGIEPVPTNVRIYNNTFYKGDGNNETYAFDIGAEVSNCRIRNNLLGTPQGGTVIPLRGGGGSGWIYDHNLATSVPGFTNASAGDFSLAAGSPAVDAGVTLPEVVSDYVLASRPRGAAADIGAYESR